MVAVLDILQSIPVLSFLPPVVLAMVALVPGHQMGIEMGVILLIFTGQVWNLAFSFYSSLKSIPREMVEATRIYRYSGWQRFWQLEMPYAAIGLVWNSIVSVAGGWFALIFCETFTMGDRNFQLPGLGSYIQTATYCRRHARAARAASQPSFSSSSRPTSLSGVRSLPGATNSNSSRWSRPSASRLRFSTLLRRSNLFSTLPGRIFARLDEPIFKRMAQQQGKPRRAAARPGRARQALRRALGAGAWRHWASHVGERCRPSTCSAP